MRRNKTWNLILSGAFLFLAIITANESIELITALPDNRTPAAVVTATVNILITAALIMLAAYNGNRYTIRSQRGRQK